MTQTSGAIRYEGKQTEKRSKRSVPHSQADGVWKCQVSAIESGSLGVWKYQGSDDFRVVCTLRRKLAVSSVAVLHHIGPSRDHIDPDAVLFNDQETFARVGARCRMLCSTSRSALHLARIFPMHVQCLLLTGADVPLPLLSHKNRCLLFCSLTRTSVCFCSPTCN